MRYFKHTTHDGYEVNMVWLFRVDLVRAFQQSPRATTSTGSPYKDSGYQDIDDYDELRRYLRKRFRLHFVETADDEHVHLIAVPTTDNKWYRTKKTQWNKLLRRWPKFVDHEGHQTTPGT